MKRNNRKKPTDCSASRDSNSKDVFTITVETPILPPPRWHLLLLALGAVLALHPIAWLLLLHQEEKELSSLLGGFSNFLLSTTATFASSSFVYVIAFYSFFVAWTRLSVSSI